MASSGEKGPLLTPEELERFEKRDSDRSTRASAAHDTDFPDHWASKFATATSKASLRRYIRLTLLWLLPSFLQARWTTQTPSSKPLHPTAYLDGLRGVAALFVCWCHMSYVVFPLSYGYAYKDYLNPLRLPFIRLTYGGAQMVAIFFVISGYALSLKPLKLMQARKYDELLSALSSSTLRRAFRLFLPCFASGFMVFVLVRMGVYEATRPIMDNKNLLRNHWEEHQERYDTLREQFRDYFRSYYYFIQVWCFDDPYRNQGTYDPHQWTIPVEFRSSLALFLSQLFIARMLPIPRRLTVAVFILFAISWGRWEVYLFWVGMLLADRDVCRPPAPRENSQALQQAKVPTWPRPVWMLSFIAGMYLCSYPEFYPGETPGFITLARYTPQYYGEKHRWWQGWGASLLTGAICSDRTLQSYFSIGPIQYLGKISYAMYLMHGPVMHTLGYTTMALVWKVTGLNDGFFHVGFAVAFCINTFWIICFADIFNRAVDIPCVTFAKWVENSLIAP